MNQTIPLDNEAHRAIECERANHSWYQQYAIQLISLAKTQPKDTHKCSIMLLGTCVGGLPVAGTSKVRGEIVYNASCTVPKSLHLIIAKLS